VAGGAALSGIGFTISLFIVDIAIADPVLQDQARVGVLAASLLAFGLGAIIFKVVDRVSPPTAVGAVLIRPVDPARDHIRGDPNAPLTLVEYGDFECPFCSRATGSIDEVRAHFGSEVRHVWRHLTLTRVHPHAFEAALASEAAAVQGRFFEMGRQLFQHHHALASADLMKYAGMVGLDVLRFQEDMRSAHVINRVRDDVLDSEVMDLNSTPTFFIGDARHHGPYDAATLILALEEARAR
jgi:protein-disulfide isomerase